MPKDYFKGPFTLRPCAFCGRPFRAFRATSTLCSRQCQGRRDTAVKKAKRLAALEAVAPLRGEVPFEEAPPPAPEGAPEKATHQQITSTTVEPTKRRLYDPGVFAFVLGEPAPASWYEFPPLEPPAVAPALSPTPEPIAPGLSPTVDSQAAIQAVIQEALEPPANTTMILTAAPEPPPEPPAPAAVEEAPKGPPPNPHYTPWDRR